MPSITGPLPGRPDVRTEPEDDRWQRNPDPTLLLWLHLGNFFMVGSLLLTSLDRLLPAGVWWLAGLVLVIVLALRVGWWAPGDLAEWRPWDRKLRVASYALLLSYVPVALALRVCWELS